DVWEVDDAGKVTDHFKQANPKLTITAERSQGPIAISETLDPTSANYMHWYDPDVATTADSMISGCNTDPIVFSGNAATSQTLHYLLYGTLIGWTGTGGVKCTQYGGTAKAWQLVPTPPPGSGEATTPFYDIPSLRSATELVLNIPRVGFFSTPAFFA